MNDRDFRAWADQVDSRPTFHSGGRILRFSEQREEVERRKRPAWEISARRRQYQLRLMRVRMEMEELL
jgi:hypothetical protein